MKYIDPKKLDRIKLTKENFYLLIDFDRTLTKGNSISGWRVLYYSGLLGDDFTKKYDEIHDKYYDQGAWEYRFKLYIDLLCKKGLSKELVAEAVNNTDLELRNGTKEFFTKMYNLNIPVIIIYGRYNKNKEY